MYSFNIGNKVLWEESPRRKRKHDFVYYSSFKMRHVPEKSRRGDHVLLPMIITHIRQKTWRNRWQSKTLCIKKKFWKSIIIIHYYKETSKKKFLEIHYYNLHQGPFIIYLWWVTVLISFLQHALLSKDTGSSNDFSQKKIDALHPPYTISNNK